MLTIRLQRIGRRGIPAHRVVVQDSRQSPKSGRVVEMLGSYDTRNDAPQIDVERASYWISQGAQTSGTVHNLLVDLGILKGKKNVLPKKTPIVSESAEGEGEKKAPTSQDESEARPESVKEGKKEESTTETPVAEEAPAEETKKEEPAKEKVVAEASVEEKKEEAPEPDSVKETTEEKPAPAEKEVKGEEKSTPEPKEEK